MSYYDIMGIPFGAGSKYEKMVFRPPFINGKASGGCFSFWEKGYYPPVFEPLVPFFKFKKGQHFFIRIIFKKDYRHSLLGTWHCLVLLSLILNLMEFGARKCKWRELICAMFNRNKFSYQY